MHGSFRSCKRVACAQPQLLLTGKVESAQQRNKARNADTAKQAASLSYFCRAALTGESCVIA